MKEIDKEPGAVATGWYGQFSAGTNELSVPSRRYRFGFFICNSK